jgi:hypothetical protein
MLGLSGKYVFFSPSLSVILFFTSASSLSPVSFWMISPTRIVLVFE